MVLVDTQIGDCLMLSALGKNQQTIEIAFIFFQKSVFDISCFSNGDNLHEMLNPVFWKKNL